MTMRLSNLIVILTCAAGIIDVKKQKREYLYEEKAK